MTIIWAAFLVWKTVTYTALWDNAIALTHQAYDLYPQSKIIEHFMAGAYNNTALEAVAQGDLNQAKKYLKQSLAIKPEAATYKNFAYLSIKQDKLDKAIKYYQKALELKPALNDLVTIHYSMSKIYLRKGETEKADLELRKASMFREIIIRANR
ncbi:MAG: tetratricopeptide repeat protein [Candidatus Euphemobacter frigidus]|nr:tetratricopeptide repeat protein [Candidatus Euphemobacter frigidus]MDP8275601.1 tetratricopeptide repeat protein [Candidatus Euphemobacter frigidus]